MSVLSEINDWVSTTFEVHPATFDQPAPQDAPSPQAAAAGPTADPPPPDVPADPSKQELYSKQPGDAADVSENDIHQGHVGDCFVLSSMGEIAKLKPDLIKKMIKDNGDGTYTVTLHQQDNGIGNAWGLFSDNYKEVQVTVTADAPGESVNQWQGPGADGKKEIWPLLLEKAYAQVSGGYAKMGKGGSPATAMATFTGQSATSKSASKVSLDDIKDAMKAGKPIVFSTTVEGEEGKKTKDAVDPVYGMHGNHAYIFEGLEPGPDGKTYVRLKNPWGRDDPKLIPFEDIPTVVNSVETGSALN